MHIISICVLSQKRVGLSLHKLKVHTLNGFIKVCLNIFISGNIVTTSLHACIKCMWVL